jgi:hypothetical protein
LGTTKPSNTPGPSKRRFVENASDIGLGLAAIAQHGRTFGRFGHIKVKTPSGPIDAKLSDISKFGNNQQLSCGAIELLLKIFTNSPHVRNRTAVLLPSLVAHLIEFGQNRDVVKT